MATGLRWLAYRSYQTYSNNRYLCPFAALSFYSPPPPPPLYATAFLLCAGVFRHLPRDSYLRIDKSIKRGGSLARKASGGAKPFQCFRCGGKNGQSITFIVTTLSHLCRQSNRFNLRSVLCRCHTVGRCAGLNGHCTETRYSSCSGFPFSQALSAPFCPVSAAADSV